MLFGYKKINLIPRIIMKIESIFLSASWFILLAYLDPIKPPINEPMNNGKARE